MSQSRGCELQESNPREGARRRTAPSLRLAPALLDLLPKRLKHGRKLLIFPLLIHSYRLAAAAASTAAAVGLLDRRCCRRPPLLLRAAGYCLFAAAAAASCCFRSISKHSQVHCLEGTCRIRAMRTHVTGRQERNGRLISDCWRAPLPIIAPCSNSCTARAKPTCCTAPLPRLLLLAVVVVILPVVLVVPGRHAVERQRRRLHLAPLHRFDLQGGSRHHTAERVGWVVGRVSGVRRRWQQHACTSQHTQRSPGGAAAATVAASDAGRCR